MNSEKVKEIKKGLECCYTHDWRECDNCTYGNLENCKHDQLMQDILALINELESENERLMKLQARGGCRVAELGIENQKLKDRIAELEKENTRLDKVVKHNQELIEDGKLISSEQLKQFAETFKQKCIDAGIFPAFVARKLEETLEEFIPDESNN